MRTHCLFVPALTLLLVLSTATFAQERYALDFSPRTGDTWMDARLGDLNAFARGDPDGFIDEVVRSFGAPSPLVREYIVDRRWAPADVYYACAIAHYTRRPCIEVIRTWETDHGQGWGVTAQRLGIKPGSAEFHALKGHVGRSHDKWHGGPPAHAGDRGMGKGRDSRQDRRQEKRQEKRKNRD